MTQRSTSADLEPLVSRERAENEFRKAMNIFVGRGRQYSVAQLAKGSRVPERLIECFRSYAVGHADYRPLHPGHLISIAKFLGPEFTSEWLKLADQEASWIDTGDDDLAALNTDAAEFNYEHSKATDPNGPGGIAVLPVERDRLRLVARRIAPKARAVAV